MLEKKLYKLWGIVVLLVLANVINAFFGKETTLQYKMQDALESHKHESALIFASKLLKEDPNNQEAIDIIKQSGQILLYLQLSQAKLPEFKVAEDQDTGQVLFYVHSATSPSADFGLASNNLMVGAKKVYEDFKNARVYAAKAKALDSRFKATLRFEKNLDEAQAYVLGVLAANVFADGKSVYNIAFENYDKKSTLINSAASSEYLNKFLAVQSAWAPLETPIETIKQNINPLLDKMEGTGQLVSDYQSGKAEDLAESLLSYIQVVRKSVDTLLAPKGSYNDFIKIANNSTMEYKKAQNKLKRALPGATSLTKFSSRVKAVLDYQLFENDSTVHLITENQYLQGA